MSIPTPRASSSLKLNQEEQGIRAGRSCVKRFVAVGVRILERAHVRNQPFLEQEKLKAIWS